MSILLCLQLAVDSEIMQSQIMTLMTGMEQSKLIRIPNNQDQLILMAYVVLSVATKRWSLSLVFLLSSMLFNLSLFDGLSESQLYFITFIAYSYVITCNGLTWKSIASCGIILSFCIVAGIDAYYYGVGGVYGQHKTMVYNYLPSAALYCNILFICSFINISRIKRSIFNLAGFILRVSRNSASLMVM